MVSFSCLENRAWLHCLQDSSAFRIDVGWAQLDPIAVGIIIILTVLICVSTKESSRVNLILVITKLVGVLFVIIVGEHPPPPMRCTAPVSSLGPIWSIVSST